jgi:hypothetical protein
LSGELSGVCKREDDYVAPGKPACDWDDAVAREALVDALARDAYAILAALDGRKLSSETKEAVQLLATVVGQDLEQRDDGLFRIARCVAKDRVISTVDPETRHGHKTSARGFDGCKGHVAIDPDSEIITATEVTPGNAADGSVAESLLADVLPPSAERKLAHLMFRRHGGRRARVRGCKRTRHDFALLAAAHNLARMARLGVHFDGAAWAC